MVTDPSPSHAAGRALAQLAQRLQGDPAFMAHVLGAFGAQERLDEAGLAAYFGISREGLARLALCKRPPPGSTEFAAQARQIAEFAGVEAEMLVQVIRQVDALGAMETWPAAAAGEKSAPQPYGTQLGWLAAARDRAEAEEDQNQAGEEPTPDEEQG